MAVMQDERAPYPLSYASGDGETDIPGYLTIPDGDGPHPAILILRGVAGPEDGYTEIAQLLAQWGYVALLHGWKIRGDDPPDAPVYDDLHGALRFLRSLDQVDEQKVAVFGFCRGGVHSLMVAGSDPTIRAVVVFHGFAFRPENAQPGAEPFSLAEGVDIPMLIMHGTEDEQAPVSGMRRMQARMQALEKNCTFKFYDGVPHGFAVRTHPGYVAEAAVDSFDEARRFLNKYLPSEVDR